MDLLPIASFLWLSGRCRYCDFRIPRRTPLVEGVTAAGCGFIGYQYGLTPIAVVLVLYLTTFIHLISVDLEHSLIFNSSFLTALILVLATLPFHQAREDGVPVEVCGRGPAMQEQDGGSVLGTRHLANEGAAPTGQVHGPSRR